MLETVQCGFKTEFVALKVEENVQILIHSYFIQFRVYIT